MYVAAIESPNMMAVKSRVGDIRASSPMSLISASNQMTLENRCAAERPPNLSINSCLGLLCVLLEVAQDAWVAAAREVPVVLVDAKLEAQLVHVVGEGLDAAREPLGVGLQLPVGRPGWGDGHCSCLGVRFDGVAYYWHSSKSVFQAISLWKFYIYPISM